MTGEHQVNCCKMDVYAQAGLWSLARCFEYVANEQNLEKAFVQLQLLPDLPVQREERWRKKARGCCLWQAVKESGSRQVAVWPCPLPQKAGGCFCPPCLSRDPAAYAHKQHCFTITHKITRGVMICPREHLQTVHMCFSPWFCVWECVGCLHVGASPWLRGLCEERLGLPQDRHSWFHLVLEACGSPSDLWVAPHGRRSWEWGISQPQGTWCSSQGCGRRHNGPARIFLRPGTHSGKCTDAVCHRGVCIWIGTIRLHKGQQTLQGQSFNLAGL